VGRVPTIRFSDALVAHAAPLVVWSGMMGTIGAISDTHGLLRPQALAALAGCDRIIHAGDIGSPDVLARLGALAPVHAVRGNIDYGAWSAKYTYLALLWPSSGLTAPSVLFASGGESPVDRFNFSLSSCGA
jgi:hypothetical protein